MFNVAFTEVLMGTLAIILVVAAVIDVRTFTISNGLNIGVALLGFAYWWAVALPLWPSAAIQLGMAIAVFGLLSIAFFMGQMGGGDVKLAGALTLWFAPPEVIRFLVVMSIAGGVLTIFLLILHKVRRKAGQPEIPYGVAIAFGGLFILAQRFLNQFS